MEKNKADVMIVRTAEMSVSDISTIAKSFVESGMFPDVRSAAQAIVKIQAGQEVGIKPFAAMTGIHIIQGKPTIGAGIIASRVKASTKYDYKVIQMTDAICSLDFYEGKEKIGNSTFTIEDAKKANTKNIHAFPRNMLFARAISNGVKWFAPDVFDGPVYTPEEMDFKTEDATYEDATPVITDQVPEEKKEPIPGHWYAKLEKCKTKEDIDELALNNKETLIANADLKLLFQQTKAKLPLKADEETITINDGLPF